jgi:hypothetical protein
MGLLRSKTAEFFIFSHPTIADRLHLSAFEIWRNSATIFNGRR